jgi:hypothetical protein
MSQVQTAAPRLVNHRRPHRLVRMLLLLAAVALSARPVFAATHVLYPSQLAASSTNDWFNESYAAGAPEADCQNASNYSTNDVDGSADYLEVIAWPALGLAAGEVITKVEVDVDGRYDTGTSGNRLGLRVRGSVASTSQSTPTWSQSSTDDACRWRAGGSGWDVTSLRGSWTAADIAGLRLAARRFANNDPVPGSRARVNSFRVIVTTTECTPSCSVDQTELDFGTLLVGSSATQNVTLQNVGSCPLTGTVAFDGTADGFTITAGGGAYTLAPGAVRTVTIRFAPGAEDDYYASLLMGDACDPVDLYGSGSVSPICEVVPIALDFGNIQAGQSAVRTFTISNVGAGTLIGDASFDCPGMPFAITQGGGAYALTPGQSRTVQVTFAPTTAGSFACNVYTGDDCEDDVVVTGTASGVAQVTIEPTAIDFGDVAVGESADSTVTLTNRGTASASGAVTTTCASESFRIVSGGGAWTLAPGQTRTITLRFGPTTEDDFECQLSTGAGIVPVTASSSAPEPCAVTPTALTFGPLAMGQSQTRQFVIRNAGTDPLSGEVVLDEGCDEFGFSIVSGDGAYTLAPGATRTVVVGYTEMGASPDGCAVDPGLDCTGYVDLVVNGGPTAGIEGAGLPPGFVALGPSPFREQIVIRYVLPAGGRASLAVYDAAGRRVRHFEQDHRAGGVVSTAWDGRDDAGRALMPGTYFVRLAAGSQQWTRSVVRLR